MLSDHNADGSDAQPRAFTVKSQTLNKKSQQMIKEPQVGSVICYLHSPLLAVYLPVAGDTWELEENQVCFLIN